MNIENSTMNKQSLNWRKQFKISHRMSQKRIQALGIQKMQPQTEVAMIQPSAHNRCWETRSLHKAL